MEPKIQDTTKNKFERLKQLYCQAEHFVLLKESCSVALLLNTDAHDKSYYVTAYSNEKNEMIQLRFRSMELAERCYQTWLNT